MEGKRKHGDEDDVGAEGAKRARQTPAAGPSSALVAVPPADSRGAGGRSIVAAGPPRSSNLEAPIMVLSGHAGEVMSAKFSPDGGTIASGSFDREVFLWRTFGACDNYLVLKGHKDAVVDVRWTCDGEQLLSASVDKSALVWDASTGARVRRLRGHTSFVNGCATSPTLSRGAHLMATACDDGIVRLYDSRSRQAVHTFNTKSPVTAVAFGADSDMLFAGGVDNVVRSFDLRTRSEGPFSLVGHTNTVTSLALSPSGNELLSNAMDGTLRIWDVKPFCPVDRCSQVFTGHRHGFEKNLHGCAWSHTGKRISCASADRNVFVFRTVTTPTQQHSHSTTAAPQPTVVSQPEYRLPGHAGAVNDVDFHPSQPILLSAGSDKVLYLGEISPE